MNQNNSLTSTYTKKLFFNPVYWFSKEFSFVFLLCICIVVSISLFKLNFPKVDDPLIAVSVVIYVFGIWGIIIVARSLIYVNIEKSIAKSIAQIFSIELSKIRGKEKDRIDIERILGLLPTTSENHESTMIRLVNHIVDDARDRKFESGDTIMRIYKEEIISQLFKINSAQKIALRLGILGTFIGLIIAFMNLSDIENIDENFSKITSALQYSFSTSIAGLLTSIILALNSLLLSKRQEQFFKTMEEATQITIALARNSINKDTFMAGFDQMKSSLDEVQRRVYDQQMETKVQTQVMKKGIDKLQNTKTDFDTFLSNITKEMHNVYKILSPEKMSLKLKESMESSVKGISEVIDTNINSHLSQYDQLTIVMEKLGDNLSKIETQLQGQIKLNNDTLINPKNDAYKAISELTIIQKEYLKEISETQTKNQVGNLFKSIESELKNKLDEKSSQIVNIINKLENSLSNYNKIIETKIPKYSRKKIIITTFLLTSLIGIVIIYYFQPSFIFKMTYLLKSIF